MLFVMLAVAPPQFAEIRVVDDETGRGVPLVELITVNHIRFVTDNAGRIAFNEPGLLGRELFFTVKSHGYEMKKDGFGFPGVRVTPQAGQAVQIKIVRKNLAERLCRLTGEGKYRDSNLLGLKPPLAESPNRGLVAGQDSVQAVKYRGEVYWFWGDTQRMSYPLGLFRTSGAKTPTPDAKFDPAAGIAFDYFTDKTGFSRAMVPLPERSQGVIWIDGVCVAPDQNGHEKLVAHYSRRKGLAEQLEHGLAVFDDDKSIFVPMKDLPLSETWRYPHGHPEIVETGGKRWLYCGNPALNVRVPATFEAVLDSKQYEAFTKEWQKEMPPVGSTEEATMVRAGKLKPEEARFYPANAADPKERIRLHNGTVRWNAYRQKWIMLAGQSGGKSSNLGEVWYAEADEPTGPFASAVKVVTHDRQSFYNVCHHAFLDRDGSRIIHFEGTYTSDFSGNPDKTPRYEYNQILYKLDLDKVAPPKK